MPDLMNHEGGVVFSRHFKTRKEYAAQPVSVNALLQVYVERFRVGCDDDNDCLVFTTTRGTPMKQGYINKGNCAVICLLINVCQCLFCPLCDHIYVYEMFCFIFVLFTKC